MFTKELYEKICEAYDFYNARLFDEELPQVLFTLQRKRNARGYFSPDRFATRGDDHPADVHEIALNPDTFVDRTDKDILSTLVHEMVHLWQMEYGEKFPRRNYHNREWADRMLGIGLIPSATGEEGGPETGTKMTHYIEDGGLFDTITDEFLESGFAFPIEAKRLAPRAAADRSKNKTAYVCPGCGAKIWGKLGVKALCGDCEVPFVSANAEENTNEA